MDSEVHSSHLPMRSHSHPLESGVRCPSHATVRSRNFALTAAVLLGIAVTGFILSPVDNITVDAPQRATVVVPQPVPTPETSVATASQVIEASLSDEGDEGLFRDAVARLSTHPELASYLIHDRLLRRFVLVPVGRLAEASNAMTRATMGLPAAGAMALLRTCSTKSLTTGSATSASSRAIRTSRSVSRMLSSLIRPWPRTFCKTPPRRSERLANMVSVCGGSVDPLIGPLYGCRL